MSLLPPSKSPETRFVAFDIETASLPRETLEPLLPEFDPSEVKLGNTKDPEKVAALIETARVKHSERFFSEAALNPLTGRVVAIGLSEFNRAGETTGAFACLLNRPGELTEEQVLESFWQFFDESLNGSRTIFVGHNVDDFDLPFLVTRSRILGVRVPRLVLKPRGSRFYFSERFVDTRSLFALGRDVRQMKTSLGYLAPILGLGAKNGSGEDFAGLLETDWKKAVDYLFNDVKLSARLAAKLGVFDLYSAE
jgi:DNA polymerase III epsilon subunit-like protein